MPKTNDNVFNSEVLKDFNSEVLKEGTVSDRLF